MKLLIGYVAIVGTVLFGIIWGASQVMTQAADNEERDRARQAAAQSIQNRVATDSLQRKRQEAMDRAAAERRQVPESVPTAARTAPAAEPEIAAVAKDNSPADSTPQTTPATLAQAPVVAAKPEVDANTTTGTTGRQANDNKVSGNDVVGVAASPTANNQETVKAAAGAQEPVSVSSKKAAKSRRATKREVREARAHRNRHDAWRAYRDADDDYDVEVYEIRRPYRAYREYRPPFASFDRFVRGFEAPFIGDN